MSAAAAWSGTKKAKDQDGWGGGGGVQAVPVGYIEVKEAGAVQAHARSPAPAIAAMLLALLPRGGVMFVTIAALAALDARHDAIVAGVALPAALALALKLARRLRTAPVET